MLLEAGQIVETVSGRLTSPVPKISIESNRKIINSVKRINEWLISEAIKESSFRNDEYNNIMFSNMNIKNLSQSDKDSLNSYLFG